MEKIEGKIEEGGVREELKIKTETMYAIQKLRIQAQLRIKAFVRDERLTKKRSEAMHHWLEELLKDTENLVGHDVGDLLKGIPIWNVFMKHVLGLGPRLAGSIVAGIYDISRFNHVSSLWKYCGQDVTADGEAPRRQSGQKISWNPFLRMTIYKITDSMVKQNADKSLYRRLYDQKKAFYQKKFPEWAVCRTCGAKLIAMKGEFDKCSNIECKGKSGGIKHPTRKDRKGNPIYIHTKGHIHKMAKRYTGKIFLQHLWMMWRRLEGLPENMPWIIEHGGHVDFIPPEEAMV